MQKQIDDIRGRLQTGQTTLSDDEKARLAREGDQLTRNLQRKQQESQDDFNDSQQDVVNRIGRKLVDILDGYSKQNGFAVVLDTSAQQTPVIYASNEIDITQEIIRLYDQKYPVTGKSSGGSGGAGASCNSAARAKTGAPSPDLTVAQSMWSVDCEGLKLLLNAARPSRFDLASIFYRVNLKLSFLPATAGSIDALFWLQYAFCLASRSVAWRH